jgi:hypothetical protein
LLTPQIAARRASVPAISSGLIRRFGAAGSGAEGTGAPAVRPAAGGASWSSVAMFGSFLFI